MCVVCVCVVCVGCVCVSREWWCEEERGESVLSGVGLCVSGGWVCVWCCVCVCARVCGVCGCGVCPESCVSECVCLSECGVVWSECVCLRCVCLKWCCV